jgi:hypothetical protein
MVQSDAKSPDKQRVPSHASQIHKRYSEKESLRYGCLAEVDGSKDGQEVPFQAIWR